MNEFTSSFLGSSGMEEDGNSGPVRWAWQHGQGRLSSGTPPSHQRDLGANTGPCLTGRQEASRGQGWEPTQGPTGDLMADARGPSHAVQSVPALARYRRAQATVQEQMPESLGDIPDSMKILALWTTLMSSFMVHCGVCYFTSRGSIWAISTGFTFLG